MSRLKQLIHEIHRRSLWQVLGIYLASSWVVFEVVQTLTEGVGLPGWVPPAALVALLIGLPVVLATAFVQEGMGTRAEAASTEREITTNAAATADESPAPATGDRRVRHRLFTWRNALLGGVAAFALLGVVTAGYMAMRTLGIGPAGTLVARSSQRIVVLPLENRAADPWLEEMALPDLATEWITSGLGRAGFEIVPMSFLAGLLPDLDPGPVAAARRTGAALVVIGSLLRRGDSIQVRAEIVDGSSGKLLHSLAPAVSSAEQSMEAVHAALERVSGALAAHFDRPGVAHLLTPPPTLEAHRRAVESDRLFSREMFEQVIALNLSAHEEDTTYLAPLMGAAWANFNLGRRSGADSLVAYLNERRSRLTPLERANLAFLAAILEGDVEKRYLAGREVARLHPGNWLLPLDGAVATNRLEEALEYAACFDPTLEWNQLEAYEWAQYQSHALHGLGRFEEELAVYRQAQELDPDQYLLVSQEVDPLVALGRLSEVRRLMDEFEARPQVVARYSWDTGSSLRQVALEARAHGHDDLAREGLSRALAYYTLSKGQAELEGTGSEAWRWNYAFTLYLAGRFDEALDLLENLAAEVPDNVEYQTRLGTSLARLGRVREAEDVLAALEARSPRSGDLLRGQARILVTLGRMDEAVERMSEAFRAGLGHYKPIHRDWDLLALREIPAYRTLTRPRGSG